MLINLSAYIFVLIHVHGEHMISFDDAADYIDALEGDPSLAILPLQMVADLRGVSRPAIDRMVKLGQLAEIRIGKTRYVQASSVLDLRRERDRQVAVIRAFLEQCAREERIVTYEPVMKLIGLRPSVPADRVAIGDILSDVARQTWFNAGPNQNLLSVLVHRRTPGKTRPGPGFFALVREFGLSWTDDDELVQRETARVWKVYAKDTA